MKNRTLPLSLLIGAALTIPSLAMAAPAETASRYAKCYYRYHTRD